MKAGLLTCRPPGFRFQQAPKPLFSRRQSGFDLYCEAVPVADLARRYGTPLYVYSAATIKSRIAAFETRATKQFHTRFATR